MRLNDDGKTVAAMDLLVPGIGELIGGSQREERLRRARRPHGGAGPQAGGLLVVSRPAPLRRLSSTRALASGFERLIMYLTGMANIRDVLPFPRTARNADF